MSGLAIFDLRLFRLRIFRNSAVASFLLAALFFSAHADAQHAIPTDGYQIVHVYPHDPDAYTQGLVWVDGYLYESTGRNGKSSIRKVDLATGQVLQHYELAEKYFGEGLTNWESELVQLTWKAGLGFVYDRSSMAWKRSFEYTGEGWGLTHDDHQFILSDGTAAIRFLDPQSFAETKRITVKDEKGKPITDINELEYVHGEIYANIWHTDKIARIAPQTGKVLGWIDLSGIIDRSGFTDSDAVLNGFAYDNKNDRLFVTGKLWPKLFEIKVVHRGNR